MKNVILVGMPACGKSTIGVVLAKTMNKGVCGYRHPDPAGREQNPAGNHRPRGKRFISTTSKSGSSWTLMEKTMVATGGSAIYFDRAMDKFKEKGCCGLHQGHLGYNLRETE